MSGFSLHKIITVFVTSLILVTSCLSAAETGKISGRVTDSNTGEPLIGANVFITAEWSDGEAVDLAITLGAVSDISGQFFILNVRPGEYNVKCDYVGYRSAVFTQVRVQIDRTTNLSFLMDVKALKGEEVLVTAFTPNKVERDLTATKHTYSIADVEEIAGVNDITDILELQADIIDNHIRGGREGEAQNLIGGASINNPLSGNRSFAPMVNAIQEVEVMTSGFSAEYGNAQSGVINMVPREGGNKWTFNVDYSGDVPRYQIWGGNPLAEKNMPFYSLLSKPETWLIPYETDGNTKYLISNYNEYLEPASYYSHIDDSTTRVQIMYNDSLRVARMAASAWRQMARYVGMEYADRPVYKVDLTVGGPISDVLRIFIAARQKQTQTSVPVPHPNLSRQFSNNLVYQPNSKNKFTFAYHFNYSFKNSVGGPTNWFDTVIHNGKSTDTEHLFGFKLNHVFNANSYMGFAIRLLDTRDEEQPEFLDPGRYLSDGLNGYTTNNTYAGRYDNTPSGHRVNNIDYERGVEKTKTWSMETSYYNQLNKSNLIKAGAQLQYYILEVDKKIRLISPGDHRTSKYSAYPFEGALYLQDKMEFDDFVANIGLRYDFYNFNFNYLSNIFWPLQAVEDPGSSSGDGTGSPLTAKTKGFGRLQPRLGVSFPVSVNTVFHLNYGTFVQRPGFNYILRSEYTSHGDIYKIGNALLKPEKTSAWDIGIVNALPGNFRLDISAYFKDVSDLVEEAVYINSGNEQYTNYTNRDYANIKGFHVNLEKMGTFFSGYLKYNYQTAKGKASSPGGALITIYEEPLGDGSTIILPDPRDLIMDYDRTHRFIANGRIRTSNKFGPTILNSNPLASMSVSLTYKYQSGRPYTDDDQLQGLVLNKRMPSFGDLRVKVQKRIRVGEYTITAYLEGFNVLNTKEWSRRIFTDNETLQRWKAGHREELIWYDPDYEENINETRVLYQYSDAYSIYGNDPQHFRLGLRIQL